MNSKALILAAVLIVAVVVAEECGKGVTCEEETFCCEQVSGTYICCEGKSEECNYHAGCVPINDEKPKCDPACGDGEECCEQVSGTAICCDTKVTECNYHAGCTPL